MYLRYFGLEEAPFSITPDPAFVYLSDGHRDALAHLLYGIGQGGSGGFVQLTGEVGTGKTTLCRCLLEQVPDYTRIALVLNPVLTPLELLRAICTELGVAVSEFQTSTQALVDRLNRFLLDAHENGQRVVVVIDEAQALSPEALEQVRLLTNLETSKEKLLQIVLLGQPELRDMLRRRDLRQLAQRITARFHLTPLNARDAERYIAHRLQVAGAPRNPFRKGAQRALFQRSHGVPRLINTIADRALMAAYAREKRDVDARMVHAAADEVQLGEPSARRQWWPWLAASAAVLLLALAMVLTLPAGDGPAPDSAAGTDSPPAVPADPLPGAIEPAAVADPPVEELTADWLARQGAVAWEGLAAAWGNSQDAWSIQAACEGSVGTGFACVRNQGSWSRIRQLGWPVVLELTGTTEGMLLLNGLSERHALVGTPPEARTVERAALEERWLGQYYSAWPQSPNWPLEIRRGDSGPAVQTVLDLAAVADPPLMGAAAFDERAERWLMAFQRRHGLEADGIVGPMTLQYLMRPAVEQPVLLEDWQRSP